MHGQGSLLYKFGEQVPVPGIDVLEIDLKACAVVLPCEISQISDGALLRRRAFEHGAYCGPVESAVEDQGHQRYSGALSHVQNAGRNLAINRALRIDPEGLRRQQINFGRVRLQRFEAGGVVDVIVEAQGLGLKQARAQGGKIQWGGIKNKGFSRLLKKLESCHPEATKDPCICLI